MKSIQLTQTAVVTKYQAFDGTTWDTPEEALSHEQAYCENVYTQMQGASYPENEIRHLPFPADDMINIYKDFSHEIYDVLVPGVPDLEWDKIDTPVLAQINYEADVNSLLTEHSAEELFKLMIPILDKYGLHKVYFYVLSDIPRGVEAAKIRNDWETALRNTKDVHDINRTLQWSFSDKDIAVLARLHKSNKFRKKIEDMLTDANYHEESGEFADKNYDDYLAE